MPEPDKPGAPGPVGKLPPGTVWRPAETRRRDAPGATYSSGSGVGHVACDEVGGLGLFRAFFGPQFGIDGQHT